jgi:hypothetical protein
MLLPLLLTLSAPALADDVESWSAVFFTAAPAPEASGFRLWTDLHFRRTATSTVGIVRPGVGWQITPWFSVWAGYAWVPTKPDGLELVHEHRGWEQLIFQHRHDRLAFSARVRQEQRVRPGEAQVNHRTRLMARFGVTLGGPVSLQVFDELFVSYNPTDWFDVAGYDQNRFFVGPSFDAFKGARVEVGYFNNHLARGGSAVMNHAVAINLFFHVQPADEGK